MFGFVKRATPGLSASDAIAAAARGEMIVLDVRGQDEIAATGKASGAITIPLMLLQMQADPRSPECHKALKQGRPVAVYCASGARSQMAVQALRQMGHEAHNIGGFSQWTAAGGPTSR